MTYKDVCKLALALPGVEESTSYGTPALKVKGKLMVRLKEDGETIVLITDFVERDFLMRDKPKVFFITDHYRDYPSVLVHLPRVPRRLMRTLLEDSWRRVSGSLTTRRSARRPAPRE